MNDLELLREYAQRGSESAFRTLVDRHLNLVYATALRQVRSPELAEEVAQSVFLSLAKNATGLKPHTILTGWLYRVTRHAAIDLMRGETRRRMREQIAFEIANMKSDSSEWEQIEPLLDEAIEALEETDRNAILLRYFENKSLREVGATLGTSEDAARKRVSRAVEQLRAGFARRSITVGATTLVAMLCAQSSPAVPPALSATISAAVAVSGGALSQATTIGATKVIVMTMMQKTLITATIAVAIGTGIYQAHRASVLGERAQALQQQEDSLAEQNRRLQQELDEAAGRLARMKEQSVRPAGDNTELLKLRGEVAGLRAESRELAQLKAANVSQVASGPEETAMRTWLDRVKKLKERSGLMPGQQIPEFQFLTDQDWLEAARKPKQLETESDYRQAMRSLRSAAKNQFAATVQDAMKGFAQANNGQIPSDLSQLAPYFAPNVGDSVLQGYEIAKPGTVSERAKSLVDQDGNYYASRFSIMRDGTSSSTMSEDGLHQAIQGFLAANNGQSLNNPNQLTPYVQTPAEKEALEKAIHHFNTTK